MTATNYLDEIGTDALDRFLRACLDFSAFNVGIVRAAAVDAVSKYRAGVSPPALAELQRRWNESLALGRSPDYGVYADQLYIAELWSCWRLYSREYLRGMTKPLLSAGGRPRARSLLNEVGDATRVVDLGCGFGYSTAALASFFPGAEVVGTNLPGTWQYEIAGRLGADARFRVVGDTSDILGGTDFVFASEFFEHIEAPIEMLNKVVDELQPRVMLIANTFGPEGIGHFREYRVGKERVPARLVSRIFNDRLRSRGYEKIPAAVWNGRPTFWRATTPMLWGPR